MGIIIICTISFLCLFFFDISQVYHKKKLARVFSIIGYSGIFSSLLILIFSYKIEGGFSPFLYPKAAGSGLFFLLLIYSDFIEIGLKSPCSAERRSAFTRGTYGIVRHPGFLWFLFSLTLLILIYKNREFTLIASSMVGMNFLLILFEDLFLFPKIFSNYADYKKCVPFIIPGFTEILKRINTFNAESEYGKNTHCR